MVACTAGCIAYDAPIRISQLSAQNWWYGAMLLGVLFILVFNLMAITTQKNGLSVAAVASKMSVAIPIVFGIVILKEHTGIAKLLGISIALIAVYLTTIKPKTNDGFTFQNIVFPLLVFIGSGIIDTSLNFIKTTHVALTDVAIFSASIFGFAAIIGIHVLIFQFFKGTLKIEVKNIVAGIALGIPNYFSIYFLVLALSNKQFDSSTLFTINNVAILLVSTIAGILFFKERLTPLNWVGITLAVISILLVSLSI